MAAFLVFDSATERLHLGLTVDAHEWLHDGDGGALASTLLISRLREMLTEAGVALCELDAIAYGRGPGAFTGLRTACAAAQGLALGAGRPVLAVDTLMAVAEDARARAGTEDVWVAMDARMGEVYVAHYMLVASAWQTAFAPALYSLDALHAIWLQQPPRAIAGSAPLAFGARMDTGAAQVVGDARPRAQALLACARDGWARGSATDPALAVPLYLRDRVALTTMEREAAKAARPALASTGPHQGLMLPPAETTRRP